MLQKLIFQCLTRPFPTPAVAELVIAEITGLSRQLRDALLDVRPSVEWGLQGLLGDWGPDPRDHGLRTHRLVALRARKDVWDACHFLRHHLHHAPWLCVRRRLALRAARAADFVTLHVPESPQTVGMIDSSS